MSSSLSSEIPAAAPTTSTAGLNSPTGGLLINHNRHSSPPNTDRHFLNSLSSVLPIHSFRSAEPSCPELSGTDPDENSDIIGPDTGELPVPTGLFPTRNSCWLSQVLAVRQTSIISLRGLSDQAPMDEPEGELGGNKLSVDGFFNICGLLIAAGVTTFVAEHGSKHNPKKRHASVLATVPVYHALNGYNILSVVVLMAAVCKGGFGSHKFSRAVVFLLFLAGLAEVGAIWVLLMMGCGLEAGPAPYIGVGVFALLLVLLVFFFGPPYTTTTSPNRIIGHEMV